jgi:hypothetical protein
MGPPKIRLERSGSVGAAQGLIADAALTWEAFAGVEFRDKMRLKSMRERVSIPPFLKRFRHGKHDRGR